MVSLRAIAAGVFAFSAVATALPATTAIDAIETATFRPAPTDFTAIAPMNLTAINAPTGNSTAQWNDHHCDENLLVGTDIDALIASFPETGFVIKKWTKWLTQGSGGYIFMCNYLGEDQEITRDLLEFIIIQRVEAFCGTNMSGWYHIDWMNLTFGLEITKESFCDNM